MSTILFLFVSLSHILAALWYCLLVTGHSDTSQYGSNSEAYIRALYFVFATLTTVGYGELVPQVSPVCQERSAVPP